MYLMALFILFKTLLFLLFIKKTKRQIVFGMSNTCLYVLLFTTLLYAMHANKNNSPFRQLFCFKTSFAYLYPANRDFYITLFANA